MVVDFAATERKRKEVHALELIGFEKVKDGKYLKNYELTYLNKAGRPKKYEIVSRRELEGPADLGKRSSGISIIAIQGDKLLLLKEFRMGVNRTVYNLCAGMIEEGEGPEDCIRRELFEETGLMLKKIKTILPPSYAAVAISDVSTSIAIVEAEGTITSEHASDNEEISAAFYSREEVTVLIREGAPFSSRAQLAAYFFSIGNL